MTKTLSLAIAVFLVGATAANAHSWSRSGSTTGSNGQTVTRSAGGYCSGSSCSSSQTIKGPNGLSASRSGTKNCSGGTCSGTATYTGPYGETVTRKRSLTRY